MPSIPSISSFLVILLWSLGGFSQDTIRVMQYNILYYGSNTSFCTDLNNNMVVKEENLSVIIDHFKPDIFAVNEMGTGSENLTRLGNNALNRSIPSKYDHAAYTNTTNSNIVNALYFNRTKLAIQHQAVVNTVLRDINLYRLYYRSADLEFTRDTIFLTCIVAHLKAGDTSSDQQTRTLMVNNVMHYLNSNNFSGNILFMGDFNMKSSFEQAFQILVGHSNPNIRFYDPIDVSGMWSNNPDMAPYHTQSPRSESQGCFVGGGLDDRFDFILATNAVMRGNSGIRYVEDSYTTIGQDGMRFNQSLVSPPNYSQPQHIIQAMYNFSDHLPVMLDLVTDKPSATVAFQPPADFYFSNPVDKSVRISSPDFIPGISKIHVMSLTGQTIFTGLVKDFSPGSVLDIDLSAHPPGVYILQILMPSRPGFTAKIIKR
jgi:endonuclease/exonuclease/phosphatase family metal-dependent hydrolase